MHFLSPTRPASMSMRASGGLVPPPLKDEMLFNADRPCRRASQARPEVRYSYGVTHRRSLESLSGNKKDKRGDECRERFSTEYYRHSTGVI